mmetsp:Transcript_9882/g.37277  ORF Transcript_9882/g.37277 Transcript_9882/m.37277 type:complete len:205 (-) Transcript_9882:389-1003(-)|eukprot:scaffold4342_cov234-Pinguiococcus_pyrenoidosus.AAC.7
MGISASAGYIRLDVEFGLRKRSRNSSSGMSVNSLSSRFCCSEGASSAASTCASIIASSSAGVSTRSPPRELDVERALSVLRPVNLRTNLLKRLLTSGFGDCASPPLSFRAGPSGAAFSSVRSRPLFNLPSFLFGWATSAPLSSCGRASATELVATASKALLSASKEFLFSPCTRVISSVSRCTHFLTVWKNSMASSGSISVTAS